MLFWAILLSSVNRKRHSFYFCNAIIVFCQNRMLTVSLISFATFDQILELTYKHSFNSSFHCSLIYILFRQFKTVFLVLTPSTYGQTLLNEITARKWQTTVCFTSNGDKYRYVNPQSNYTVRNHSAGFIIYICNIKSRKYSLTRRTFHLIKRLNTPVDRRQTTRCLYWMDSIWWFCSENDVILW